MERDVSLLRCSKLSCYSEFNRMVQAIARNGGGDITTIPGTRPQTGTSAEYNFYTTLVLMLKQIISNRDPTTQKRELQRVYEWFCLNKPLIKSKTKPTQRKPKFSITTTTDRAASTVSFPFPELDRPQTAPASLYQPHRFSGEDTRILRGNDRKCSSPPRRRPTFTAMYISQSLSRGMDLIGQPFDQLQLQHKQSSVPLRSQERISSTEETIDASKNVDNDTPVKENKGSSINVIDFPSSDFPTHQSPSRQRPDTTESTVSLATVFSMAPGVAAQMILERELNEHCESNRKRALSLHTSQTLRIGGDYQPNRRLVNTPTDSATVEPLHLKRYSATADSINTSERVKQQRIDPGKGSSNTQTSPSHQERAVKDQDESKSPQSAIKSGGDETDAGEQSSNLEENQIQAIPLPSEAQEMMLDMKVVDSRTSTLSLSQVSLKQKESPRTKRKQNNHGNAISHLQIEGQGVKPSSETAQQSPRLASTAAQREHQVNSPRLSTRVTREAKSGSLTSLLIRPVSLQHHSGRTGATSESVNHKVNWNNTEKDGDHVDNTEETEGTTTRGDQKENTTASDTNHVAEDSEVKNPVAEDSLTLRPDEKDLPANSDKRDSAQDEKIQATTNSESQDTLEKTLSSNPADYNLSLVNEKPNDGGTVEELPIDRGSAVAINKELTETNSSVSQDIPGEMPQSPIVMVKASPTPARPSSSLHKSRLLSPMNIVSLSFPSDMSGNTHPVNRHTTTAEAGRKTPTIIAGFNKKRYRRLKSTPAAAIK